MSVHFINGQWLAGQGEVFDVINPANGITVWSGGAAVAADVDSACQAARAGFRFWSRTPLQTRIAVCQRFRDLLKENAEQLAGLIALEVGKPLWEARTEVASMAAKVDISVQSYY